MNRFTSLFVALAAFVPLALNAQVDRSQAPEPGPAPEIILGDYTVETLENGLTLIVVENHKLPRVSYRLTLDVDAIYEGGRAGYTSMAGSLMRAGTANRTKAEIDETVDLIGANFGTSGFGMNGRCLVQAQPDPARDHVGCPHEPHLPRRRVGKGAQANTLSGFASSATDANQISGRLVQRDVLRPLPSLTARAPTRPQSIPLPARDL